MIPSSSPNGKIVETVPCPSTSDCVDFVETVPCPSTSDRVKLDFGFGTLTLDGEFVRFVPNLRSMDEG